MQDELVAVLERNEVPLGSFRKYTAGKHNRRERLGVSRSKQARRNELVVNRSHEPMI
jgi:hypothetical protein